jgi:hypothetical protein
MIATQVPKQPQPQTVVGPKSSTDRMATMPAVVSSQYQIRERGLRAV